jgi:hypothetical protein
MNHNDDFIGQLEDYLHEFDGVTPLPDGVRDAVRAELPSARQVRPRPGPERVFTMLSNLSGLARLGLAAAVIVVAVVLGGAFLNNGSSTGIVGGGQTPTPAAIIAPTLVPTSAPTTAPTPAVLPALGSVPGACDPGDTGMSCVPPGTYQLSGAPGDWPVTVTVNVPAGWFEPNPDAGFDAVLVNAPDYAGSGWGVMFTTVGNVYRDPCDLSKGTIPAAQVDTPQKLAAAITAWPGFTATAAQPITVDGHSALELKIAKKAKSAGCGYGNAWLSASGVLVDAYPFANGSVYPTTIRIVDTGRGLLVIRATDFPNTSPYEIGRGLPDTPTRHAADQPQLHAILDSIRLTVPPASS